MYCVKCGVKLADSEQKCPLCGVAVYHPDIPREEGELLFPRQRYPEFAPGSKAVQIIVTTLFLLPLLITLLCDLRMNRAVTWSGYVMGALLVGYVMMVLPYWFRKPNPVIFVPCSFGAVGLYLLYINFATGGAWFLSLGLPVTAVVGLIVTAVVTLVRYVSGGRLYIFGGAFLALGVFMPVMEFLINFTFRIPRFFAWSQYPLTALVLLGGMLIFLGINRSAREKMERRFFL